MHNRVRKVASCRRTAVYVIATGILLTIVSTFLDGASISDGDVGRVGLAIVLAGMWCYRRPAEEDAYHAGLETGKRLGESAARRRGAQRPVVVPIRPHRCECQESAQASAGPANVV